jgi:hypothetical protein
MKVVKLAAPKQVILPFTGKTHKVTHPLAPRRAGQDDTIVSLSPVYAAPPECQPERFHFGGTSVGQAGRHYPLSH